MASAMHWVTATYVGLKKLENIFNWFDGEAPTYLPWCDNDPKTENCAGIYPPNFCVSSYTCLNDAPLICKGMCSALKPCPSIDLFVLKNCFI